MQTENVKITLAIEERGEKLIELQHALEVERRGKSVLEAGVVGYIEKIQDLEVAVKNAKERQEMRTSDLRNAFANLRKSQEKGFDEFEGKVGLVCSHMFLCSNFSDFPSIMFQVVFAQSPSEQRISDPPL
jgi:hypothetical protein